MIKRMMALMLALVLAAGVFFEMAPSAAAASDMKVSDELVKILKMEEGFSRYPIYDYGQYSVGYGTRCPDDMLAYYREHGITESEAELLLRNYLKNAEKQVNSKLIDAYNLTLTQGQFDAIVSFSYNMGTAWLSRPDQNIHYQIVSGGTGNELIDAFSRWCNAGGQVLHYLVRRRLSEANMYLNGVYSRTAPGNYCYVVYNGNGGTPSQSVQGYDSDLTAAPVATATYNNYTFLGWYTAQVGGTKVESLTADLNCDTLYAHWQELESVTPDENPNPITVKVTVDSVNLRKGPGTNYAIIGIADRGQTFDILQVRQSGGYTWGQYHGGWVCLQYTNYDQVIAEPKPTEPQPTEPQPTEPEATEPQPSDPAETEKPTEPPTEPATQAPTEPTVPPTTKPATPAKVMGTVHADPYLCVRKGPGTGYATVDTLRSGERVEITEQKTVGSMIWGKIRQGWISMTYVKLDSTSQPEPTPGPGSVTQKPAGQTGTVNCDVLNIRSGAGVNYGIVGYYTKNTSVTVTEQKTVGSTVWGKTSRGWVSMDYVTLKTQTTTPAPEQGGTTPTTPPVATTGKTGKVTSSDVLRIRSGAGTSYSIVGFLNPGTKVTITEEKTVGSTVWGKTSKGWISMDYVKLDSTASSGNDTSNTQQPAATQTKTVTASCLLVRSGAGTNYSIVGYLYKGAKVTVSETTTVGTMTWGKTNQGWICLDYTK